MIRGVTIILLFWNLVLFGSNGS